MESSEFSVANAQLKQALKFFTPIAKALEDANGVFSVLSNATDHQDKLLRNLAALQKTADDLKAQAEASALAITANDAAAVEAKAVAAQAIVDAQQQADTQVKEILASVATDTKAAKAAFAALQADIAAKTVAIQTAYGDEGSALAVSKQALEAEVKALETKLDKLKEQAKKFAASLTAE